MLFFVRTRIYCLLFMIITLSGCASNPYRNVVTKSESGKEEEHFFRYGGYCGNNHPFFESVAGSQERTNDLLSIWPPKDNVDTICYAHDMCYNLLKRNLRACDHAVISTLLKYDFKFEGGCRSLVHDISSAMLVKPNRQGQESTAATDTLLSFIGSTVGAATALITQGASLWDRKKYGYPDKAGSCNAIGEHSNKNVVIEFQRQYQLNHEISQAQSLYRTGSTDKYVPLVLPIK